MEWSLTHLEGLKDICKHQVQINQPLPPEVLTDKSFTYAQNDTNVHSTDSSTDSVTNKSDNVFTPEFLAKLVAVSCLNECSGQGNCTNGRINSIFILFH